MISLSDKNIIVTGASSGIGRTCAIECGKAGARVHIIGRNMDALHETMSKMAGECHSLHQFDVTDYANIQDLVSSIVDQHGKLAGFIHSAGIQITKPLRAMDPGDYINLFSVNTISAFEFSKWISLKANMDSRGLSIVFISSVMSIVANPGLIGYCSSKAALVGGARAMALELAPKQVRVNCISPGYIEDTPMMQNLDDQLSTDDIRSLKALFPSGLGLTTDISGMCLYLLSDEAKWLTGQNIVIDGGYSIR